MDFWVPRRKVVTFVHLGCAHIQRLGENASRVEIRRALARAWDSVDDRMGQVAYDNLFWKRTIKDSLLIAVRSLGWNVGDIREIGGAAFDVATLHRRLGAAGGGGGKIPPQPPQGAEWSEDEEGNPIPPEGEPVELRAPWFTHRMAYTLYAAIFLGALGGMINFMLTGKKPENDRDLYFPKTGGKNKDGSPERLNLPSYAKDVYAWAMRPCHTLLGKLNPGIQVIENLAANREFPNTQIYKPRPETMEEYLENGRRVLNYLGRELTPISMRQITAERNPASALPDWGGAAGLNPAPGYVRKSRLERAVAEWHEANPTAPKTPEAAEKTEAWRARVDEYRKATPEERIALREKPDLLPAQRGALYRHGEMTPLQRSFSGISSIEDQMRIYELGTPEQKKELKPLLENKLGPHAIRTTKGQVRIVKPSWGQNMTEAEKTKARERLRGLLTQEQK